MNFTLQWGRDRMIAEIADLLLPSQPGGLLQWGRDRMIAEMLVAGVGRFTLPGFNGAAIG